MEENNMKNIIVLKDLPSNLIEEAIVILKENANIKKINKKKESIKVTTRGKVNSKEYIIKEAESVVASYIASLEKPKQMELTNNKIKKKYENLKKLTAFFAAVAILGIIVNFI